MDNKCKIERKHDYPNSLIIASSITGIEPEKIDTAIKVVVIMIVIILILKILRVI